MRQVHMEPVRDVARGRLDDDLAIGSGFELFDDVVIGVGTVRDPPRYRAARGPLDLWQRSRQQYLPVAGVRAVAIEGEVVRVRHEDEEASGALGRSLPHRLQQLRGR